MSILWGQNQYAQVASNASINTILNNLTVMVKCTQTVAQSLSMFISRQTSGTPANEWWGLTLSANAPRALIGNNSGVTAALATTAISLNTPYFLVMTYDGTTINLYQNMSLVATASISNAIVADTTPVTVNGNANGTGNTNIVEFFSGYMEDLRVYNRTLSLNELQTIYVANGEDGIVNGLTIHYKMNELSNGATLASGASIKDYTHNSNDAITVLTGTLSYDSTKLQTRPQMRV